MRTTSLHSCAALLISLTLFGCDNKKTKSPTNTVANKVEEKTVAKYPKAFTRAYMLRSKTPVPNVVMKEIMNKMVTSCTWQIEKHVVTPDCGRMKYERLDKLSRTGVNIPMSTALTLMATNDVPEKRLAATWLLNRYVTADVLASDTVYILTSDEEARFKELIKQSLPKTGRPLIRSFVLLMTRAQKHDAILRFLPTIADDDIRAEGYRHLMVFARLGVFSVIKKLVEDEEDAVRRAALQAPLRMAPWTPKEQDKVCSWSKSLINHLDRRFRGWPVKHLRHCSHLYMDDLLRILKDTIDAKDFQDGILSGYDYLCGPKSKTNMKAEQCNTLRDMLMSILTDESLKPDIRATVLEMIFHQWPDARTFKICGVILKKSPGSALGQKAKALLRTSNEPAARKALKHLRAKTN